MRSAFIAAFAAGAIAVPHHLHKPRALVTDWDIVYVTDIVTVTESAASAPTGDSKYNDYWHWTSQSKPAEHMTETLKPETTTIYVAPTSAPAVSSVVYQAPSSSPAPESTIVYSVPASQPANSASATSQAANPYPYTPSTASSDYQQSCLDQHNKHRSNHSAPALEWDDNLASCAQQIVDTCIWGHSMNVNGGGYGQNLDAGHDDIAAAITDGWYNNEYQNYDFWGTNGPDMNTFDSWGHISQLLWKDTNKVGCATKDCTSQGGIVGLSDDIKVWTVCNYQSPGNYNNDYKSQVGAPLGTVPYENITS